VGTAVGLVLALAQQPVQGAFNGSTANTGNGMTTAPTFCTTPGSGTVTATADSSVNQANSTSVGGGVDTYVVVTSQFGSARRVYVRFDPMPNVPSRCSVTSATLQLWADSQVSGRTLEAYRADPTVLWTEAGLHWDNKPAGLGTPVPVLMPNGDQYINWIVTDHVKAIYALGTGGNNGFMVRDQAETGGGAWQQFNSRDAFSNKPQLTVTWG
jgi:large repetitive protein